MRCSKLESTAIRIACASPLDSSTECITPGHLPRRSYGQLLHLSAGHDCWSVCFTCKSTCKFDSLIRLGDKGGKILFGLDLAHRLQETFVSEGVKRDKDK